MPVTVPIPWLIEKLAAPVLVQARVVAAPAATPAGVAVKLRMTGGGTTVTVTDRLVLP